MTLRALPNPDWRDRAACRTPLVPDAAVFSPVDHRGRVDYDQARHVARTICGGCPVRAACRDDAEHRHTLGLGPQELVEAGLWWPPANARNPEPVNLLDDLDGMDAA